METKIPRNLKELIQRGYAYIAKLPEKNNIADLDELDAFEGYTVPLIAHDYGAKTPVMWNSLYEKLELNIRNIMIVAEPKKDGRIIIDALKSDPKYMGGGFGVGWKERMDLVDETRPGDLSSINIVVKENDKLIGYNTDAEGFVRTLEEKFVSIRKKIDGSNIILLGAGGVAKEVSKLIAKKNAKRISIINRTVSKAVELAYNLNNEYKDVAIGAGEEVIRGYMLNSFIPPDAVINLTDKGNDGPLKKYSAFASADTIYDANAGNNLTISRTIARELKNLNSNVIIADIVLPKNPPSRTLEIAKNAGLKNLLDGIGMVVYQAVPAYIKIQEANPEKHKIKIEESKILEIFKETGGFK